MSNEDLHIKLQERDNYIQYKSNIQEDYLECIRNVEQMAEIQQSLNTMLCIQGERIDNIEKNITDTSLKVEKGNKELKKASKIYWKLAGGVTAGIGGAAIAGPIGLYYGIKGYSLLGLATGSGVLTGMGFKKIKKY